MTQLIQMPRGSVSASLVVHLQGAHVASGKVAAHAHCRNLILLEVGEQVKLPKEPVGDEHKTLDAALQHHLDMALELFALVIGDHDDWQIGGGMQRLLD